MYHFIYFILIVLSGLKAWHRLFFAWIMTPFVFQIFTITDFYAYLTS